MSLVNFASQVKDENTEENNFCSKACFLTLILFKIVPSKKTA